MKPKASQKTVDYKKDALSTIGKLAAPTAFFDNEMKNVRMFRAMQPLSVEVFRLNTFSHAGDPGAKGAKGEIHVIDHYAHYGP